MASTLTTHYYFNVPVCREVALDSEPESAKEPEKSINPTIISDRVWGMMIPNALTTAYRLPAISEVIFNEEAGVTVVIWTDGEKTIVRLGEGERFDRYTGFMAAVCKRMFGGTTPAKKLMNAKDRKYQAQLKAEAAAKEKAKRIVEAEKQREKTKKRREKEEHEGFDALVQYYVREFQAKDKAREMMAEQTKIPFDDTEGNA